MLTLALIALFGPWGPTGCAASSAVLFQAPTTHRLIQPAYTWTAAKDQYGNRSLALYRDTVQIGGLEPITNRYRAYDAQTKTWGGYEEPPVPPPAQMENYNGPRTTDHGHMPNFGLDLEQLTHQGESITANGFPVSFREAATLIKGDDLPNDDKLPWLVFVGPKDRGDAFAKDWASDPKYRVQVYEEGAPMLKGRDGKTLYPPGVTLVAADSKELHHQDEYTGKDTLANALRQLDKDFDQSKVPDLTKPKILPAIAEEPEAFVLLALLAAALLFHFISPARRKG